MGARATARRAAIRLSAGGKENLVSGHFATIAGGQFHTASAFFSTVSGGNINTASANLATVGGGEGNTAEGQLSTVSGGRGNTANGFESTVGGGEFNTARGLQSTVAGGVFNESSGLAAAIGGGGPNTASGDFSSIPGGFGNKAAGDYSFAAGRRAEIGANHDGAFLFADSTDKQFTSASANEFAVRAKGGVRFVSGLDGSLNPSAGVKLLPGAGAWSTLSDRNAKANFAAVDSRELLDRLARVPIDTWSYRSQDESVRHIGPTAQDFYSAFGVGEDPRLISTLDADGVALAAIQGLYQLAQAKDARIASLESRLTALEQAVTASGSDSLPAPFTRTNSALLIVLVLLGGLALGRRWPRP